MKFLPFNTDRKLWLRPRYHWRLAVLNLLCIFLGAGAACYYGVWLAGWLGVGDGPLRDEPRGLLWAALFFLGFVALVLVAHLLSFALMAVTLRWSYGWGWPRIRELMFASRIPAHWLREPPPAAAMRPPPPRRVRLLAIVGVMGMGVALLAIGHLWDRDRPGRRTVHYLAGALALFLGSRAMLREMRPPPP